MNKEAEAEIERQAEILAGIKVKAALRDLARWVYADAVRVCREEAVSEPTDNPSDEGYNAAIAHCVEAIEERAKS